MGRRDSPRPTRQPPHHAPRQTPARLARKGAPRRAYRESRQRRAHPGGLKRHQPHPADGGKRTATAPAEGPGDDRRLADTARKTQPPSPPAGGTSAGGRCCSASPRAVSWPCTSLPPRSQAAAPRLPCEPRRGGFGTHSRGGGAPLLDIGTLFRHPKNEGTAPKRSAWLCPVQKVPGRHH